MSEYEKAALCVILAVVAAAVVLVMIPNAARTDARRAACEARGGVFVTLYARSPLCLRADAIVDDYRP